MHEPIPRYKLTEEFDNTIKSIEFETSDLVDVFSQTIGFLKYCGITEENLFEMFELYKKGEI